MNETPKLNSIELKKLLVNHSVRENLRALTKQTQLINELASSIKKSLSEWEKTDTIDQTKLLANFEQLRVAKYQMKGIRFIYFYDALRGVEPRHSTTEKFEVEKWMIKQQERAERQAQLNQEEEKGSV